MLILLLFLLGGFSPPACAYVITFTKEKKELLRRWPVSVRGWHFPSDGQQHIDKEQTIFRAGRHLAPERARRVGDAAQPVAVRVRVLLGGAEAVATTWHLQRRNQ